MLAGYDGPSMAEQRATPSSRSVAIDSGRLELLELPGGAGSPLLVLGGVELGLRHLAGTEQVLARRWERRAERRPVTIVGRPIPDDPADAGLLMHPRIIADGVARALADLPHPVAVEAESGGGRIALWLTVDHPELVSRLVLASVASETPQHSPMADRLGRWILLAEAHDWGRLFAGFALQMRPAAEGGDAGSFTVAARLQPRPSTPERFIAELRATLDPSSFVTARLGEVTVPTLVLAGGLDQVVPADRSRQVAEAILGARFELDPQSGHTVRASFHGYHELVEAFLDERQDAG
jgi:pimeloyl-ACP methyl ester carboxylesterase